MAEIFCTDDLHLNDVGTIFEVTILDENVAVPVDNATVKQIIFLKPDGTKLTKNAGFVTDGTNGVIYYVGIAGDLNVVGIWGIQGFIDSPTWEGFTSIAYFRVKPNL